LIRGREKGVVNGIPREEGEKLRVSYDASKDGNQKKKTPMFTVLLSLSP
jgi:hypothetical protein